MSDHLQGLAHDHRELTGLLLAVRGAVGRVEAGQSRLEDELHEIRDGIEVFREALLEHFAREQEGLFPFVLRRFPDVAQQVDGLIGEHDRIAELLTALMRRLDAVDAGGELKELRSSLARFEELYALHSKTEIGFLTEIAEALESDQAAMQQLNALLDER